MSLVHQTSKNESSKVLIVDDEEVARFILGKWLGVWKVSATFCNDAQSGLEAFRRQDYQLAIIDHYLPDGTGLELIKSMRLGGASSTAFALHSTDLELHHAARQHEVDYFLPKPFSSGGLYNILWETSCKPQPYQKPRPAEKKSRCSDSVDSTSHQGA